ncbi:hypothetical protein CMO88_03485 [Candidatus Woesearchaeota archaeon]|nr:hypothetical protein [Candidatus Woesearchaeota archaeon]|tara:strand:- start:8027 stop:8299 length:273 start_codon:yes stop_codon:yes gene_type:complete
MVFSKRFPKTTEGSVYPKWVEISLTEEEEKEVEQLAREEHVKLFKDCVEDAKKVDDAGSISIALGLFDKRASHVVFLKEKKCKEKFEASD